MHLSPVLKNAEYNTKKKNFFQTESNISWARILCKKSCRDNDEKAFHVYPHESKLKFLDTYNFHLNGISLKCLTLLGLDYILCVLAQERHDDDDYIICA